MNQIIGIRFVTVLQSHISETLMRPEEMIISNPRIENMPQMPLAEYQKMV
jgi:hypothetical protein